jgi:general secretion pathway protein G
LVYLLFSNLLISDKIMMQNVYKRGFTLIELLVVIAIIGILAGIVLAALGNTRQKGADAGVQGNLDSIRTQAEVYAGNHGNSYTGVCGDTTVAAALASAKTISGATSVNTTYTTPGTNSLVTCHEDGTSWAVDAPLKSITGWNWCVDSTGIATSTNGSYVKASNTTCAND